MPSASWGRRSTGSVLSSSGTTLATWPSIRSASCASDNFPRASAIVGRAQETFVDSSGRRRSLFGYAFGDLDHGAFYDQIRDIQFVQDRAGFLRVRIVTNPGADKDQIQRTFEQRVPMAKLEFEYVSAIERSPSGKRRYFVDGLQADERA